MEGCIANGETGALAMGMIGTVGESGAGEGNVVGGSCVAEDGCDDSTVDDGD